MFFKKKYKVTEGKILNATVLVLVIFMLSSSHSQSVSECLHPKYNLDVIGAQKICLVTTTQKAKDNAKNMAYV